MAIVADHRDTKTGQHRILGVGRLVKSHARNEGEVAVLVSDSSARTRALEWNCSGASYRLRETRS